MRTSSAQLNFEGVVEVSLSLGNVRRSSKDLTRLEAEGSDGVALFASDILEICAFCARLLVIAVNVGTRSARH